MKKYALMLCINIAGLMTLAYAQDINLQLPSSASSFVKTHFSGTSIEKFKKDHNKVKLRLSDGTKIEFDEAGDWREVSREKTLSAIPNEIIPAGMAKMISQNYPSAVIKEIERNYKKYKISLSNGLELEFDWFGNLLEIDH